MAAVLADLLKAEHVTLALPRSTRDEALRGIVATMEISEPEKFLAEVIAREEVHTTFMGNGVAFPHARTDLVTTLQLGIGRSVAGVPFGKKRELAQLIFVIGVPKKMINNYLVCVGALARVTKVEETRAALLETDSAADFIEILRASSLLLE